MIAIYIVANSNVFGMVKDIKIYRQSAAKVLLKYRIRFNEQRKQSSFT